MKKMLVKARCFPRWAAPATHAALEPSAEDARWFEPIAKHATHVLDGVPQKQGYTHAVARGSRPRRRRRAAAGRRRGGARENAECDAPLSSDWKRVSDVVHDVVQDELALHAQLDGPSVPDVASTARRDAGVSHRAALRARKGGARF